MVIELAGLPGAGKTTICTQIAIPHRNKYSVPLTELRLWTGALPFARHLFLFCASCYPFSWSRFERTINIMALLRCYRPHERPTVLDQGLVQKIWSIMLDAEVYSETLLERVMADIKPFAPRYVVQVETPLEYAALRISQRSHGKSRFDGLTLNEIYLNLRTKERLLIELIDLYQQQTGVSILRLNGLESPYLNALKIDELLREPRNRTSSPTSGQVGAL
jgi:hypothetical protein